MMVLDHGTAVNALLGAKARVVGRRELSDGVVELALQVEERNPRWEPGAHIDVCLPSGAVRQYSLCGRAEESVLRVAVLREPAGRGGSAEIHDRLLEGTEIEVNGPRNHFHLENGESYVFVAGGIGITPILAMIRSAVAIGRTWTLFYGGRTRTSMAYLPELDALVEDANGSGRVEIVPEDELGRLDLAAIASVAARTTPVYACGPEPLLAALEERVGSDLLKGQLHLERFGAAAKTESHDDGGLDEFEVVIASTETVLPVAAGQRLIDVVRTVAPQVPFSCEEGYCGSCETGVLEGLPCHRDQVLTDDEREANDTMMICVGRALTKRIVLDL